MVRLNRFSAPQRWGCTEFLNGYPEMALEQIEDGGIRLVGTFRFAASLAGDTTAMEDQFQIAIEVPRPFPREIPTVFETGERIPRSAEFHVNSDASLCLGSPIRLLSIIATSPTILGFTDRILVPFLFAVSESVNGRLSFPFGELPHGAPGALTDYQAMFGLKTRREAKLALQALSTRKRIANKRPCPCGCGLRLGKCPLRLKLNPFREAASRAWFAKEVRRVDGVSEQDLGTA